MGILCMSNLAISQFPGSRRPLVLNSPLVMKVRSRASSVMSGASTPGGGAFKSLSEGDLKKADEALSHVNGVDGGR